MKHLYLSLALIAFTGAQAQTTAMDFTADDCDGMSHTLFNDLDAGYCVIIDLVMMGCPSCGPATLQIHNNVIPNVSDPSRVKFYSIGYTNSITCSQITSWRDALPLTHPVFAGMSAMTTYYGGMGMPTVVVLGGGSGHGVYYNELGHSASDNPAVIAAVNEALAASIGIAETALPATVLSPNPAQDMLTITGGTWARMRVLDLQGKEVANLRVQNGRVDVSTLQPSAYMAVLTGVNGEQTTLRFEKR
jgi:hypothetical protein